MNFRVLKNRELAASIFLFVALGFGLYGGVFIFPLFTQTHSPLHADRDRAGAPAWRHRHGGDGAHLRPAAQRAAAAGGSARPHRPRRRDLRRARCGIWATSRPAAGEPDVRLALIVRGAGLGFLFTPINNVAYASLKPSEAQQAAGLINLARQLGGSFGIAILATYLTVHTQIHRVDLLANVYAGRPEVEERIQALTDEPDRARLRPEAAHRGALALLDQQVMPAGRDAELQRRLDAAAALLHRGVAGDPDAAEPPRRGRDAGRRALSECPAAPPPAERQRRTAALPARGARGLEVLLAHPGGPFWRDRDAGAWTIPKGMVDEGEELLDARAARVRGGDRHPPEGPFLPLGSVRQKAGKVVHAWAWEGDADPARHREQHDFERMAPGLGPKDHVPRG